MRALHIYAALAALAPTLAGETSIPRAVSYARKIDTPKPRQKFIRWKGARRKNGGHRR